MVLSILRDGLLAGHPTNRPVVAMRSVSNAIDISLPPTDRRDAYLHEGSAIAISLSMVLRAVAVVVVVLGFGCSDYVSQCTVFCANDMQASTCEEGAVCSVVGNTCGASSNSSGFTCVCTASTSGGAAWRCGDTGVPLDAGHD